MKTIDTKVKDLLNMRTSQQVANDILELEAVKKSLTHFMASYNAVEHPECVEAAENNLSVIKTNLRALYTEMEAIKASIKTVDDTLKVQKYKYSSLEVEAIQKFNSNPKFSITE